MFHDAKKSINSIKTKPITKCNICNSYTNQIDWISQQQALFINHYCLLQTMQIKKQTNNCVTLTGRHEFYFMTPAIFSRQTTSTTTTAETTKIATKFNYWSRKSAHHCDNNTSHSFAHRPVCGICDLEFDPMLVAQHRLLWLNVGWNRYASKMLCSECMKTLIAKHLHLQIKFKYIQRIEVRE